MKEYGFITDKLSLFEKMYDSVRVVDPIRKVVFDFKDNEVIETKLVCHDFWKNNSQCDNCISIRAYRENDTVFKIEQNGEAIFMVTAIPVEINDQRMVVEFLKKANNNLYYGIGKNENSSMVFSSIDHMNQIVVRDFLTKLYNRRFINERLPNDLFNATVKNEPLSLIFADIDHFKKVNDNYGHSAGDQVLREFAEILSKHIRCDKDWVARYGGEEFLVCLPDTDLEAARAIAERIREAVMQKEFILNGKVIHITSSFGVHSVHDENECLTIDGLIDLADKKLYNAKLNGRNRVVS